MIDCMNCKFMMEFIAVGGSSDVLNICTVEDRENDEDGGYHIFEVSEFNSKDCIMFKAITIKGG